MSPIRILIADDHPVVRSGLRMAISLDSLLEVVGEAVNGQDAIDQIDRLAPDLAVLDIGMPIVDGISAAREIRKRNREVGIILLTAHQGEDLFRAAMDAGANGYLLKDNALLEITSSIRAISSGGYYVTRSMAVHLNVRAALENPPSPQPSPPSSPSLLAQLAPVERRIVQMIAAQQSTRDIAGELRLSVRTVENRRALICEKLGIGGANALLKFALDHKDQIA